MTGEHWLLLLVIIHVIGFWILLFWVLRLRRQVRCLHFCFVRISDWGIDKLKEVLDYYWAEYGKQHCPFTDTEELWGAKIDFLGDIMKRARIRVQPDNHIHYATEDLRK